MDDTAAIAARYAEQFADRVRLVRVPQRGGKANALNAGMSRVSTDMVLFADARQRFDPAVVRALVRNLADPSVGAVSGELVITDQGRPGSHSGSQSGVGLYWRYEKAIRRAESMFGSSMGFTGAIAMIRSSLYHGLPSDTLLDDLVTPLRIMADGYRVVFEPDARALDTPSPTPGYEFRRGVNAAGVLSDPTVELWRLVGSRWAFQPGSSCRHKTLRPGGTVRVGCCACRQCRIPGLGSKWQLPLCSLCATPLVFWGSRATAWVGSRCSVCRRRFSSSIGQQ
jgi:glycosyltransferase involved in cell wall biosynthesis